MTIQTTFKPHTGGATVRKILVPNQILQIVEVRWTLSSSSVVEHLQSAPAALVAHPTPCLVWGIRSRLLHC